MSNSQDLIDSQKDEYNIRFAYLDPYVLNDEVEKSW